MIPGHCINSEAKDDMFHTIIMATYNDLLDEHYEQELSMTDE